MIYKFDSIGDYMRLYKSESPFLLERTDRPWGFFNLFVENSPSTVKILYVKKDEMLSLQFHFGRDQLYYLLDSHFIIDYSNKPIPKEILDNPNEPERFKQTEEFLKEHLIREEGKEGDIFSFRKLYIHRAWYKGPKEEGRVLDLAWGNNDEQDIVRVRDKYQREDFKNNHLNDF